MTHMRHVTPFLCLATLLPALPVHTSHAQAAPVIENPRPIWKSGEALHLGSTPVLVVGTQSGPMYEFDRLAGAVRLHDGRIVVADGGSMSLRFFDSAGTFLKSVGRRGGGPGEFQALRVFFAMPGDTLVAGTDIGDLSYLTGAGQYLERRGVMNPSISIANAGMPVMLAPLDGSGTRAVAALPRPRPRGAGTRWVDSFPVAIVDAHNVEIGGLGTLPSMELAMSEGNPRQVWFGATAVYASGNRVFYIGYGSEYTIRGYSSNGKLLRIIRRAWTPVHVTRADIDAYVVEWGKRWIKATGAEAEAQRDSLRNDPYAAVVPAFAQFLPDRVGRLWVRDAHLADAPGSGSLSTTPLVASRWSVFDQTGHWLGDVTMPARFQPRDIGANYVLGTAMDEDGVQSVVLYRLGTSRDVR
jgi:hypothetical protein